MYDVLIRKNATGEVRRRHLADIDWGKSSLYLWTDGNFGCDCNRHLEFERAAGVEVRLADAECGDTRYAVLKAILPDGKAIEIDEAEG